MSAKPAVPSTSAAFETFYGGAATEVDAIAALIAVDAEVFSLGQAASDPGGLGLLDKAGNPTNTFIFGFAGVGGQLIPEPSTALLLGLGLLGIGSLRRSTRE